MLEKGDLQCLSLVKVVPVSYTQLGGTRGKYNLSICSLSWSNQHSSCRAKPEMLCR